jgi:hypothetical protein
MSSLTAPRGRVKPCRKCGLAVPLNADGKNGVLRIVELKGRKVVEDEYLLDRVPSDFGAAFHLVKRDYGDEAHDYHVCLNGDASSCECPGFLRWNHCRHIESLAALCVAGRL